MEKNFKTGMTGYIKKILPTFLIIFTRKIRNLCQRQFKRIYNLLIYRGNAVLCPCCNKTFRTFIDYQYSKSSQNETNFINNYKNTICPNCGSKPRHRIVCNYFNDSLSKISVDKILMFGAEDSIKKWFKRNGYKYLTADLYDKSADVTVDIQKTPFPAESWSLIICNHVLQHVDNFSAALSELKRVLTKDGLLELTVAKNNSLETTYEDSNIEKDRRMEEYGQSDYLRIFGRDFKEILENTGFCVELIDGDMLPSNIKAVTGPGSLDDNKVYLCRKR